MERVRLHLLRLWVRADLRLQVRLHLRCKLLLSKLVSCELPLDLCLLGKPIRLRRRSAQGLVLVPFVSGALLGTYIYKVLGEEKVLVTSVALIALPVR